MYYTALVSMVLVLFLFLKDKKFLTKEEIIKRNHRYTIDEITKKEQYIKNNIKCLRYTDKLQDSNIKEEYILLYREDVVLTENLKQEIYLNYLIEQEKICAFTGRYISEFNKRDTWKDKIKGYFYSTLLNYISIFDKDNIDNYFIIMLKTKDLKALVNKSIPLKNIKSFDSERICINIKYRTKKDRRDIVEKYLYGIRNMSIKTTVRIGIFIITASTITFNLLNNIISLEKNIYKLLVSIFMYYCYSKVVKYIYKSVGRLRYIAPYLFPLYIISYIITYIYIVIDKKHMS